MTTSVNCKSSHILVVDDEPSSRILLRATLEKAGYLVSEAEDGDAALQQFQQEPPDAILLDVMMPKLNGFDCCSQIRQQPKGEHIPVMMITGLDDVDAIHRAFESGATDFVSKPINWTILCYRIKYMLRARDAFRDVIQQQSQIQELAFFDHLTGLANRTLFMENLGNSLSEMVEEEALLGLLFMDLDRFKSVNDSLGHHTGDMLLKGIADRISSCIRESDHFCRMPGRNMKNYVARLGGDEFTVLLPQLRDPENAGQVAQRINKHLTKPFLLEGTEVFVSVSIGIAIAPIDTDNAEELVKCADLAMYHTKEKGKNHFQYFKQELNIKTLQRLEFENDVRQAVAAEEFELYFQPQIDFSSSRISGAEALTRWHHAERGWISPGDFIPVIEELGLIVPFTDWVIRAAVEHQKAWTQQGIPQARIAINISSKHFIEQSIPTKIKKITDQEGLGPEWLELEMTESVLADQNTLTIETLDQVRELGMKIAVDDFGTGYSSLAYLKVFPIDIIKIDRFFIKDLLIESQDAAIVRAIIALASSLRIKVIAEGIEEPEQYEFLCAAGADYGQGFLFSKAVSATEFARMVVQQEPLVPDLPLPAGTQLLAPLP